MNLTIQQNGQPPLKPALGRLIDTGEFFKQVGTLHVEIERHRQGAVFGQSLTDAGQVVTRHTSAFLVQDDQKLCDVLGYGLTISLEFARGLSCLDKPAVGHRFGFAILEAHMYPAGNDLGRIRCPHLVLILRQPFCHSNDVRVILLVGQNRKFQTSQLGDQLFDLRHTLLSGTGNDHLDPVSSHFAHDNLVDTAGIHTLPHRGHHLLHDVVGDGFVRAVDRLKHQVGAALQIDPQANRAPE